MAIKDKKILVKKKMLLETILVVLIAVSPFLYKIYEYLPLSSDGSVSIFWLKIEANGFEDASFYLWFLTSKIVPLYLLIFWFLTSRDWWYHIILIPIAMYGFQLFEVIYDTDDIIDTENIWWLIPICLVIIPFVYLIRIKLYDKHVHGIDLEAIDTELKALQEKEKYRNIAKSVMKNEDLDTTTEAANTASELVKDKFSIEKLMVIFKNAVASIQGLLIKK